MENINKNNIDALGNPVAVDTPINYHTWFSGSWNNILQLEERVVVIRAERSIGKTKLLVDLIENSTQDKQVVFVRSSDTMRKEFGKQLNSHFGGKYVISGYQIYRCEWREPVLSDDGVEVKPGMWKKSEIVGLLCSFLNFGQLRSAMLKNLEYFMFDEYNVDGYCLGANPWESFFQMFCTCLRESKVFKKCIFIANRDGGSDNDIENAMGLEFENNGGEEIIRINGAETGTPLIFGINCGKWFSKEFKRLENDALLRDLASVNKQTNDYFNNNKTMRRERKTLINFVTNDIESKWTMKIALCYKQEQILVGEYKGCLFVKMVSPDELDEIKELQHLPVAAFDTLATNSGAKCTTGEQNGILDWILTYYIKHRIFYESTYTKVQFFAILELYKWAVRNYRS